MTYSAIHPRRPSAAVTIGNLVIGGLMLSAFADTISGPSVVVAAGLLFVLTLALPQTN